MQSFYRVGNVCEIAVGNLLEGAADNAGTRYADIYHALRFAGAVKCASHERVILGCVAEHNELCRADAVVVGGELGGLSDNLAHERDRVHVYARLCRAYIYARADMLGSRERLGYAVDECLVSGGEALLNECGISADEVDSDSLRRLFERECVFHRVAARCGGKHGDGGDCDALVDYRHAVLFSISQPTLTRFSALRAILSYTLRQESSISCEQQSSREMPMVIVRISKFSSSIICIVSRMSLVFIIVRILSGA